MKINDFISKKIITKYLQALHLKKYKQALYVIIWQVCRKCQLSNRLVTSKEHTLAQKGQLCSQQAWLAFTRKADFLTNLLGSELDLKSIFQLRFGSRKTQGRVSGLTYSYIYSRLQSFYASYKIKAWHHFQVPLHAQLISHFICLARWGFVCGLCVCIFREFLIGQRREGGWRSLREAACCVPPGWGKAKETWHPNGTCVSRLEMTGAIDETWAF